MAIWSCKPVVLSASQAERLQKYLSGEIVVPKVERPLKYKGNSPAEKK